MNAIAVMPAALSKAESDLLIEKAVKLASIAHEGQTRKFSNVSYVTHPIAVSNSLIDQRDRPIALLHDVLEDTKVTEAQLREQFPDWVVDRVKLLSRKHNQSYREFIVAVTVDASATRVKAADIRHNMSDLKPGSMKDKYDLALHILAPFLARGG